MKRIFLLIACLSGILTLCSCTKPALSRSYEGKVAIRGSDYTATAEVTSSEESITIRLTRPKSLSGLTYAFKNGEMHASLGELDCITDDTALPDASAVRILFTVLSRLDTAAYRSCENGIDHYLLGTPYGNLDIKAADGEPVSLTVGEITYSFNSV